MQVDYDSTIHFIHYTIILWHFATITRQCDIILITCVCDTCEKTHVYTPKLTASATNEPIAYIQHTHKSYIKKQMRYATHMCDIYNVCLLLVCYIFVCLCLFFFVKNRIVWVAQSNHELGQQSQQSQQRQKNDFF